MVTAWSMMIVVVAIYYLAEFGAPKIARLYWWARYRLRDRRRRIFIKDPCKGFRRNKK